MIHEAEEVLVDDPVVRLIGVLEMVLVGIPDWRRRVLVSAS